jgi:molybdenum cofactor synthesis domain-containing protein
MSSPSATGPTAAILIIGDEILSGKVEEENARFLIRELRGLGVAVRRVEVIPDVEGEIAAAVRTLSARHDHVFTSGGVGPTHDDVTMPAVAEAFAMRLERRAELVPLIRRALGPEFHERDLRMAEIPDGARLIYGPGGREACAEPLDRLPWPVVSVRNVYVLPGVPVIFRRKFELLREVLRAGPIFGRAVYSRLTEGPIADALDAVVAEFPGVSVGSYPRLDAPDHKVKITLDGRDRELVERATARLCERLGPALVRAE